MKIKEFFEKYANVEFPEEQEKQVKEFLGIKEIKKWKPKKSEIYYFLTSYGDVGDTPFMSYDKDQIRLSTGNCFKTEEEAKFRLEQMKVYNELKNFADDNNEEIDWEKIDIEKYYITYDCKNNKLDNCYIFTFQRIGEIYFSSQELVEQAIEKVGADRIKKYLFGVE